MALGLLGQAVTTLARAAAPLSTDTTALQFWSSALQLLALPLLAAGFFALQANLRRRAASVALTLDIAVQVMLSGLVAWRAMEGVAAPPDGHGALTLPAAGLQHIALTLLTVAAAGSLVLSLRARGARGSIAMFGASLLPYRELLVAEALLIDVAHTRGSQELTGFIVVTFILTLLTIARQAIAVRDSRRRDTVQTRLDSETRFRSLVQHSTDLITILDGADTIRYVSPAISRVFGHDALELEGTALRDLAHGDDVVPMLGFLADAAKPFSSAATSHWRLRHANGSWCRVETVAVNLLADPTVNGIVLTTRDVTQRVQLEEQLVHRAFHDELTGLANRALFTNRVEQALLRATRDAHRTAVLFLDLDDFKEINDSLGHGAGDSLLIQGADRLRACLRSGDTAARLGGDEFAVLLEGCLDDGEEAMHVAERIANAFARPFDLEDREAFSTASIGVAITGGKENVDDLLRNADLAMYLAKKRGKARVERFAAHMHQEVVERLDLLADLRYAIERDELQLEYQPIVDLATRRVSGLETLVRWDHPRRGRIAPADFIPLAEQSGLIISIGRWVMLHACAHARHWSRSLPELIPVTVTVNLSARQLGDENLIDDVANAIRVAGLQRDQLVLELTESTLLANSEETVGILTSLKALGVRLAIDDFGTGYSSLSYLHRFPVDILKIDKSFVDGVSDGPGANALASAVIALGQSLGLRTVAEGIEREVQHDLLESLGCKFGQGYLYSPPLPPAAVMPYLRIHGQFSATHADAPRLTPTSNAGLAG